MSDILELNLLAKPIPGEYTESQQAVANIFSKYGVTEYWIDLILANARPERLALHSKNTNVHPHFLVDVLFTWADTPEGSSFWSRVFDAFHQGNYNPIHLLPKE